MGEYEKDIENAKNLLNEFYQGLDVTIIYENHFVSGTTVWTIILPDTKIGVYVERNKKILKVM